MKTFAITLALVAAAGALPSSATDLSTNEIQAMSPRAADAKARADLLSILEPTGRISAGMLMELRAVEFSTRPVAAAVRGLCEHDVLSVVYRRSRQGQASRDMPVRPVGVEASPRFKVVGHLQRAGAWEPAADAECAHVATELPGWFSARDAVQAARAALLLEAAVQKVRSGELKAEPCPDILDRTETCEAVIFRKADPAQIDSVTSCSTMDGVDCFEIDAGGDTEFTVRGRFGDGEIAPSVVESIAVEQYITVTQRLPNGGRG
jgi:hypothetical protein